MKHFILFALVSLAACSSERPAGEMISDATSPDAQRSSVVTAPSADASDIPASRSALLMRVNAIDAAIADWRGARTMAAAKAGAEKARNLITGPNGPGYGDLDRDGEIAGKVDVGLLPGLAGQSGLASDHPNPCMQKDVLGGDFSDAAARWATMDRATSDWRATNNTFPALPSHPQRIVGWATLALTRANLAQAREYAGHAQLHADKTRLAVAGCER